MDRAGSATCSAWPARTSARRRAGRERRGLGAGPPAGDAAARRAAQRPQPGVKDLRYGYVVDEDWDGCDPDALLEDHSSEIPFLPTANTTS